ncbi:serine/threonine-protein kinase [Ureaplasma parvum]|uniref:Serine/threonine kinase n=3 Tax=Ureaplasma parvum TaxID=134821 RepID=Q9PQS6_UREPA|nr:serine/threonine-protein kinase [Ureaplasma parvum]pir/B82921/ serine/threonine kinase UU216 [imported] - Ureaplasma urealyticum [Ureaplasma urealyticum]AAF30624.1 serine/threonine kinase [Ureaplasma parvum serovar 3 str. ATCC 700970]ACA32772.1 serine/threonine kinase [Ureaplasma parvum serovar 3 str. ATCC 27815]ASD24461.1 serine/threonine protein kinase [Ureaplasma parvum]ASD25257.1 serine/threonine protein kinase [Ureaplasma parvum]ASD28823.1 serine/threonine protein kinase [Ureaplasma p
MREEIKTNSILNYKYKVVKHLADGGFSKVYLCCFLSDETKFIVIKVLDINDEKQQMVVYDELRISNLIKNSDSDKKNYIMEYYEYFETGSLENNDKRIYIVFEYIEGLTLREYLDEFKTITYVKAVEIIRQVALGVSFFHSCNPQIIHRDLKPENCMINKTLTKIKIIDYGAASVFYNREDLTKDQEIKCTIIYASPKLLSLGQKVKEQANKGLNKRALSLINDALGVSYDIHSLGVMLYELITGTNPFSEHTITDDRDYLEKWITYDVEPLSLINKTIPKGIDNILMRCFAWKKEDNKLLYKDIYTLIDDLSNVMDPESNLNQEYIKPLNKLRIYRKNLAGLYEIKEKDRKWYLQKWFIILISCLSVILIILLIIILFFKKSGAI